MHGSKSKLATKAQAYDKHKQKKNVYADVYVAAVPTSAQASYIYAKLCLRRKWAPVLSFKLSSPDIFGVSNLTHLLFFFCLFSNKRIQIWLNLTSVSQKYFCVCACVHDRRSSNQTPGYGIVGWYIFQPICIVSAHWLLYDFSSFIDYVLLLVPLYWWLMQTYKMVYLTRIDLSKGNAAVLSSGLPNCFLSVFCDLGDPVVQRTRNNSGLPCAGS